MTENQDFYTDGKQAFDVPAAAQEEIAAAEETTQLARRKRKSGPGGKNCCAVCCARHCWWAAGKSYGKPTQCGTQIPMPLLWTCPAGQRRK